MAITAGRLGRLGACAKALAVFEEIYGREVPMTVEAAVEHAEVFDWWWAAGRPAGEMEELVR